MHPRIILFSAVNIAFDLLCLGAAAIVLLSNNLWLTDIGPARFWLVVMVIGIGLVPVMYAFERDSVARRIGANPEKVKSNLPAWAGVERSMRDDMARA